MEGWTQVEKQALFDVHWSSGQVCWAVRGRGGEGVQGEV